MPSGATPIDARDSALRSNVSHYCTFMLVFRPDSDTVTAGFFCESHQRSHDRCFVSA